MRIPAIEQVIPAIDVIDVNIVILVAGVSPVFRIRIKESEPIATVLEAWIKHVTFQPFATREAYLPSILCWTGRSALVLFCRMQSLKEEQEPALAYLCCSAATSTDPSAAVRIVG